MLKLVGLILIALSGAAVGWVGSDALAKRQQALDEVLSAWRLLRARVAHLALPLPEALFEAARSVQGDVGRWLEALGQALAGAAIEGDVADAVTQTLMHANGRMRGLRLPDVHAVAVMFASVSWSDAAGLPNAFVAGEETLATLRDEARVRHAKDGKLYKTLGVLAGLSAALLLW